MSTPAPVVADTVGGGAVKDPGDAGVGSSAPVRTYKYSRTYEHYVTNSMDAYGYNEAIDTSDPKRATKMLIDEGWFIIPYWNPAVSMQTNEVLHLGVEAQAIRIKRMGFAVQQAMIMRQEVVSAAGTATITNSFASQPYFEVFKDKLHKFDSWVVPRGVSNTTFVNNYGAYSPVLIGCNSGMTSNEVATFADGLLPRAMWSYDTTDVNWKGYTPDLPLAQAPTSPEIATPWNIMSTLTSFHREFVNEANCSKISHSWSGDGSWYRVGHMPINYNEYASLQGVNDTTPAAFPICRKSILTGAAQTGTRGNNIPNCKHNIWQALNLGTGINTPTLDVPVDCYLKLNRLLNQEGPMQTTARILVEYTCEIESIPVDNGFGFNSYTGGYGDGGDTATFYNTLALGQDRRFYSWGVPTYTSVRTTETPYNRIYQPATLGTLGSRDGRRAASPSTGSGYKRLRTDTQSTGGQQSTDTA